MKCRLGLRQPLTASALLILFLIPRLATAFCHETRLVRGDPLRVVPASAAPKVTTIEWLGHSAFLLSSSRRTQVLMDPHGRGGPSKPIFPHVITTSHPHESHSFIWMASGNPIVLHGINIANGDWNPIHKVIRDVSIYTVPTYHDSQMGLARGKNAAFVISLDGICVAHLGDLGHLLNESQLKVMGKIDVLLVPLGQGGFRISSEDAAKVVGQVKPKIAIPYHYRWEGYADEFARLFPRARKHNQSSIQVSRATLNHQLEIIVLKDGSGIP